MDTPGEPEGAQSESKGPTPLHIKACRLLRYLLGLPVALYGGQQVEFLEENVKVSRSFALQMSRAMNAPKRALPPVVSEDKYPLLVKSEARRVGYGCFSADDMCLNRSHSGRNKARRNEVHRSPLFSSTTRNMTPILPMQLS